MPRILRKEHDDETLRSCDHDFSSVQTFDRHRVDSHEHLLSDKHTRMAGAACPSRRCRRPAGSQNDKGRLLGMYAYAFTLTPRQYAMARWTA